MIKRFLNQLGGALRSETPQTPEEREHTLRVATAVLMVDVARADHSFEETESVLLIDLVRRHFELTANEAEELALIAGARADETVSLHEFTDLLHAELDEEEKAHVVDLLWRIAYADGRLDKYESALVLKISDLLHVSRGRVMRLKHDAAVAAGAADD